MPNILWCQDRRRPHDIRNPGLPMKRAPVCRANRGVKKIRPLLARTLNRGTTPRSPGWLWAKRVTIKFSHPNFLGAQQNWIGMA